MQDYHQLRVWERAHAFAIAIRRAADHFPPGYSELRSQIIRAAESIPSNLVEGCGAATRREFARFVDISIKSSAEVQYRLELARDHSLLAPERWQELTGEVIEIRKMLHGFSKEAARGECTSAAPEAWCGALIRDCVGVRRRQLAGVQFAGVQFAGVQFAGVQFTGPQFAAPAPRCRAVALGAAD